MKEDIAEELDVSFGFEDTWNEKHLKKERATSSKEGKFLVALTSVVELCVCDENSMIIYF